MTTWDERRVRQRFAEHFAEDLHSVLPFDQPPIDPFLAVNQEHPLITLCVDDFEDAFDGQLEYHPSSNRFILFLNTRYNQSMPEGAFHPRTRFSLAHELGHYFLPEHHAFLMTGGASHGSDSEFSNDILTEREADSFAAAFLMPSRLFRPDVNRSELSLKRLTELKERYQTSLVSTTVRAVTLSDFPCAVVAIRENGVAWSFLSDSLLEAGCYPPQKGSWGSSHTAKFFDYLQTGRIESGEVDSQVSHWFRTYGRYDLDEIWLTQTYVTIPSMQTLLVLLTLSESDLPGT